MDKKIKIGSVVRTLRCLPDLLIGEVCLVTSGGGKRIGGRFGISRLSDLTAHPPIQNPETGHARIWWVEPDAIESVGYLDPREPFPATMPAWPEVR